MTEDPVRAPQVSGRSRLVASGLILVAAGMLFAVGDVVIDTIYCVQIFARFSRVDPVVHMMLGLRVIVYVAALAGTIVLCLRTRRNDQRARAGLIWLMFGYLLGCVVNFLITDFMAVLSLFVGLAEHDDLDGGSLDSWEPLFFASAIGDGTLALLALTAAILLIVGGRREKPRRGSMGSEQPVCGR